MTELTEKKCLPCEGGVAPLTQDEVNRYLDKIPGWNVSADAKEISRKFAFPDYYHTMAFVNAIAWMAHEENHHPDLAVGYNYCHVRYNTHAIGGLSENDIICAAKINQLCK